MKTRYVESQWHISLCPSAVKTPGSHHGFSRNRSLDDQYVDGLLDVQVVTEVPRTSDSPSLYHANDFPAVMTMTLKASALGRLMKKARQSLRIAQSLPHLRLECRAASSLSTTCLWSTEMDSWLRLKPAMSASEGGDYCSTVMSHVAPFIRGVNKTNTMPPQDTSNSSPMLNGTCA